MISELEAILLYVVIGTIVVFHLAYISEIA